MKAIMFLILAQLSTGATLHSDQGAHLVRREATKDQPKKRRNDCQVNYEAGTQGDAMCHGVSAEGVEMAEIQEEALCREAADEHCPSGTCIGDRLGPFQMDSGNATLLRMYPRRCFKVPEVHATGTIEKWYWNGFGGIPDMLIGTATPVCKEIEYKYGNVSSDGSVTCGTGYHVITLEDPCRIAAGCLGHNPEQFFKVLESSEVENTPLGCHVNNWDQKAQFNPFTVADLTGSAFVGNTTPICNLTIERGTD